MTQHSQSPMTGATVVIPGATSGFRVRAWDGLAVVGVVGAFSLSSTPGEAGRLTSPSTNAYCSPTLSQRDAGV